MCLMSEEGVMINSITNENKDNKNYLYKVSNNWLKSKSNKQDHPITKGKEELK